MIPIIAGNYSKIVISLLNQAKTNLDIIMYQWGYYSYNGQSQIQKLNYAITSAIRRGVACRVLLHPGSPMDHLSSKNNETANHLKSFGAEVKFGLKGRIIHAKILLIDKTIAVVGSHNFSRRSMASNIEASVMVDGAGDIGPFQDYFDLIWRQN